MIDGRVQCFLQKAVNSRIKLQLLLMFHENPCLEASAPKLAERCCRDRWSVAQALSELAESGVLAARRVVGGESVYGYLPEQEYLEPIESLVVSYDDPLERDLVFRSVRELSEYGVFAPQMELRLSIA